MKDKILMLVIGILIGAVITAGGFLIFGNKTSSTDQKDFGGRGQFQMENFTPGEMPQGGPGGNSVAPTSTTDASTSSNT